MKPRRDAAEGSHGGEGVEQSRRLQEIADMKEEWRQERERMTLCRQPCRTLQLCGLALCSAGQAAAASVMSHPVTLRVVLPSLVAWVILQVVPGPHQIYVQMFNFCVEYVVWWLGLGILSSIGLGNGLPTGVMFLFPHVMHTSLTAQACGTVDFHHFGAIWFRASKELFKCPVVTSESEQFTAATFLNVWVIILIPSFIQATGTCIGEIPPYWMARAARMASMAAGGQIDGKGNIPEELEVKSQYWIVNRVKAKMISFLRSYGFLGVFLMAAWPNFAFDLCGICCGHFLMPFWVFFGATFLGKGCVRTLYQSLFFTALSSEKYLDAMIKTLQYLAPDSLQIDKSIHDTLQDLKLSTQHSAAAAAASSVQGLGGGVSGLSGASGAKSHENSNAGSTLERFVFIWQVFMTVVLVFFVVSIIHHFAQYYQSLADEEKEKRYTDQLCSQLRNDITSPVSGRVLLPPPTPKKRESANSSVHTITHSPITKPLSPMQTEQPQTHRTITSPNRYMSPFKSSVIAYNSTLHRCEEGGQITDGVGDSGIRHTTPSLNAQTHSAECDSHGGYVSTLSKVAGGYFAAAKAYVGATSNTKKL